MKHKIATLGGTLLDAAVAKAEGFPWRKPSHGPCCTCQDCGYAHDDCQCGYSNEWEMGGPIIQREHITIIASTGYGDEVLWSAEAGAFGHYIDVMLPIGVGEQGPTPLIAAMRAYCASVFGEEVELED